MPESCKRGRYRSAMSRRKAIGAIGAALAAALAAPVARAQPTQLAIGLTPVFLTNDVELLSALKSFLEKALGSPVRLVFRRTYEEITSLLISGKLDAAWICGYPYIAFRDRLDLLAAPIWQGRPLYQSYFIAGRDSEAASLDAFRDSVHAFSDPNSNSGYLVTAALLAQRGIRPEEFFKRVFFTYGHRNVVRAVASGLASSGSVDGYVWEVMTETEPGLAAATKTVRKSEWLGFPPIVTPRGALRRPEIRALQTAFVGMNEDRSGQALLAMLRLDGFEHAQPGLFDGIAAKAGQLKGFG